MAETNIYLIKAGKFIKIGHSNNVEKRSKQIQTSLPFPIETIHQFKGHKSIEAKLHKELEQYRLEGEWFQDHPAVYTAFLNEQMGGLNRTAKSVLSKLEKLLESLGIER